MASLQMDYDPAAVEPGSNLDPLPPGEYVAQIIESDVAPPRSGNGLMLNLTWEVTEGEYQGRKFWQRINYQHTSAQAQLIGQQQLKAICDAIAITGHISDSEVLHGEPCRVRVAIDDKDKSYAPKNEVKSVKPLDAALPNGKSAPQPAQPPASKQSESAPARPWGNRAAAAR
jgi:hypothetical protein